MAVTKTETLAQLRDLQNQLFSAPVVAEVKKLPQDQQMAFAASRLHLTSAITALNAALMRDIGDKLQAQAADLQAGIDSLSNSLDKLEGAAGWAQAINGVLGVVDQVIDLI